LVDGKEADPMAYRTFSCLAIAAFIGFALANEPLAAQSVPAAAPAKPPRAAGTSRGWRAPSGERVAQNPADAASTSGEAPRSAPRNRAPVAKVTPGPGTLPADAGQVWRDYDISPYTTRVTATKRPEQAIIDWVLRETGYEAWHGETVCVLTADRRTLRVYHTPELQAVVGEVVDRFVTTEAGTQAFNLRIFSVENPNWRGKAQRVLKPVGAQSAGVQAWLLAKEDAALLMADVSRRNDFREYGAPQLLVNNGQSTVVSATRPRTYVRDVIYRGDVWPGFEPQMAQIDEGFSLEFSPLASLDGYLIDAVIKCNVDQVEKMIPVNLEVPTANAPRQRTKVEVPQMISCRLQEKFRFPTDQALLISLGVVATPAPAPAGGLPLGLDWMAPANRADLLLLIECKGNAASVLPTSTATAPGNAPVSNTALPPSAQRVVPQYRGRF
jgi:hypothetical protein